VVVSTAVLGIPEPPKFAAERVPSAVPLGVMVVASTVMPPVRKTQVRVIYFFI
jgi:hypothetical protein